MLVFVVKYSFKYIFLNDFNVDKYVQFIYKNIFVDVFKNIYYIYNGFFSFK